MEMTPEPDERLRGKVLFEHAEERLHEADARRLRAFEPGAVPVIEGHGDTDECRVRPVVADGIKHCVHLAPVFTRDYAAVALVPVENQLAVERLLDDDGVDLDQSFTVDALDRH